MKTFTVPEALQPLLDQMSRDMAVPVDGLVNQALFNWAKLHGYAAPTHVDAPTPIDEPPTSQVPIVDEPETNQLPVVSEARRVFLVFEDRELELEGERFVVGRDVSCHLTIDSPRLSRQHAAFLLHADGVEVQDLNSSNGTWFNGERITRRPLLDGDEIFFGDVAARVEFR